MGNWVDELDKDTKEYDRQLKQGADEYDKEVSEWWGIDDDNEDDEEE